MNYPEFPMRWETSVSMLRNPLVAQQLGMVLGIPFGLLSLYAIWAQVYEILYLVGIIIFLFFFVIWFFWRGKYEVEFVLDATGIVARTQRRQYATNRLINSLLMLMGVVSGKPAAVGMGMMAQARLSEKYRWKYIKRIKVYPTHHTILINAGFAENMAIFCLPQNFDQVLACMKAMSPTTVKMK